VVLCVVIGSAFLGSWCVVGVSSKKKDSRELVVFVVFVCGGRESEKKGLYLCC
jgi:hypothetical protein